MWETPLLFLSNLVLNPFGSTNCRSVPDSPTWQKGHSAETAKDIFPLDLFLAQSISCWLYFFFMNANDSVCWAPAANPGTRPSLNGIEMIADS